jgi:ferric-dicitrate binding protein FerR (iron transport regulator)
MVETRIKPHLEQVAEREAREQQRRLYRRNQALGLVLIAALILVWWLFHTNPRWICPPGWWRP